jgi:photosystem II stability/assembly factor-like uncharacterized protein
MKATHVKAGTGDVVLLIGTTKGAFIGRASGRRSGWELGGPYFPGQPVYAMAFDARGGRNRLWAAAEHPHFGANLHRSDDFGRSWTAPERALVRFPEGSGWSLKRVWQIQPGRADEPDSLYCGSEPAALFESTDGGESWALVTGLFDHPHRSKWQPGGGGLGLHTIVPHPQRRERMIVAISTGGVYRTEDGGRSWTASNRGVRADFLPDKHPEFGQCVHKIVAHPARPERLFLQNHWGLYRSDDGGRSWEDIAHGVPSDFGFAMAIHPQDPDCAYIVPLESDQFRCTPEGKLRVYRTTNAGRSWKPLGRGLPQKDALETVLRDGLATDALEPAGVYFGTRSGKVYASCDGGDRWSLVRDGLPPVLCVKVGAVSKAGATAAGKRARPARAKAA